MGTIIKQRLLGLVCTFWIFWILFGHGWYMLDVCICCANLCLCVRELFVFVIFMWLYVC